MVEYKDVAHAIVEHLDHLAIQEETEWMDWTECLVILVSLACQRLLVQNRCHYSHHSVHAKHHRVTLDQKDSKDLMVHRDHQVLLEKTVSRVIKDHAEIQECLDHRDLQDGLDHLENPERTRPKWVHLAALVLLDVLGHQGNLERPENQVVTVNLVRKDHRECQEHQDSLV